MAIIYSYPQETNPQPTDLLIGTSTVTVDGKQSNVTRSYSMQTITDYIKTLGGVGVQSITFNAPLTGGTITNTGTVTIPQSGATSDGYLSQADWNTFNNKLGGISGTQYKIPIWSTTAALGNSSLTETGGGTTVTSSKSFVADGTVDLGLTGTRWNAIYGATTNTTALVVGTSLNANGSEGTAGQLLTSGGPGAAMSWVNASTIGDIYTLKAETKSGSYVPVTLDAATGTDSTVRFTEGTGITLTEGGASPTTTLTIEANTAAVTNGATTTLATGDQIYDFTVALPLNSFAAATGDIDAGTQKIINLGTPVSGTDATTKTYVDSAVANVGTFQGGYNAATNTPDLDVSPATDIQNGWFWAVQVAGTFFTQSVQPGDFIYAATDNPGATEGNWTVIDSANDVATATTLGIVKVPTAGGLTIDGSGNIEVPGFAGTTIAGNAGLVPDSSGAAANTFLAKDGTWTVGPVSSISSITINAGLTGASNPIVSTGDIGPDYAGAANIVLSSTDGTGVTLVDADQFMFVDDVASSKTVKYGNLSQLKTYIGNNPGTGNQFSVPLWDTTGTLGDSVLTQDAKSDTATKLSITNGIDLEFGAASDLITANTTPGSGNAGDVLKSKGAGAGWEWGTAPASYTKWVLTGQSGTQDVTDGNTVLITSANTAITTVAGATDTLTITSTAYGGGATIGHVPSGGTIGTFLQGDGNWAAAGGGSLVKDEFTATASQTAFTVSQTPLDINYVNVFVSGVYQNKSAIASVSGTTVTLQTGVPVGTKVEMVTSY